MRAVEPGLGRCCAEPTSHRDQMLGETQFMKKVYFVASGRVWMSKYFRVVDVLEPFRKSYLSN